MLLKEVKGYLRIKLLEIIRYCPDWEYLEIGIGVDHVYLYMLIPPKYAVSKAVEVIKSNTCRALKQKFNFLHKVYWDDKDIWAKGYFVSTVGITKKSYKHTSGCKKRKIQDKHSLNFNRTTPVRVWCL